MSNKPSYSTVASFDEDDDVITEINHKPARRRAKCRVVKWLLVLSMALTVAGILLITIVLNFIIKKEGTLTSVHLRIPVIGDWGDGSIQQIAVAEALNSYCHANLCGFIISTGDNFYPNGLNGTGDSKFKELFLDVYNKGSLHNKTWYGTLGNHDWEQNTSHVQYEQINENYHGWHMINNSVRAIYSEDSENPLVLFIFVDSTEVINGLINDTSAILEYMAEHWKSVANESKNVILVTHRPIYSEILDVNDTYLSSYRIVMDKFIKDMEISVVLSGHNHIMSHFYYQGVHHIVSGSGGSLMKLKKPKDPIAMGAVSFYTNGFAVLEFTMNDLFETENTRLKFIDSYGNTLHYVKLH
jgi:tartrate-resistant acid phosphatase type 5